jgi:hypothetical protein
VEVKSLENYIDTVRVITQFGRLKQFRINQLASHDKIWKLFCIHHSAIQSSRISTTCNLLVPSKISFACDCDGDCYELHDFRDVHDVHACDDAPSKKTHFNLTNFRIINSSTSLHCTFAKPSIFSIRPDKNAINCY